MATGVNSFLEELARHFEGAGAPGGYERVGRATHAALSRTPALLAPFERAWAERSFEAPYARPLLTIASMRYRALEDADHPLAPELLLDADAPEVEFRTAAALADPALEALLSTRSIQTNEAGRAYGWGLPALVLGLAHRHFALVDLGCSAGLNLVVDRTAIPFRFGTRNVMGYDFPSPEARVGIDIAPIDITDEDAARWLRACIWPGQSERLHRFEVCRKLYTNPWPGDAPRPTLHACALGTDGVPSLLERAAESPGGDAVLLFESVVRPYLSNTARDVHDAQIWDFLARHPRRARAILEPAADPARRGGSAPMDLTISFVRGGERHTLVLAQAGYHASNCLVMPGAPERARALWDAV